MKRLLLPAILLLAFVQFYGCSDSDNTQAPNNNNPTLQLSKIDSGFATGSSSIVALYSESSLKTGYNKIYAAVYDSATGAAITDAHVSITPMMDMGTMIHSAPKEDPTEDIVEGKWFKGAVVFIMPSNSTQFWEMHVHVHNHTAPGMPSGEVMFSGLSVADNSTKYKTLQASDGSRLYLSYIEPSKPIVGINDLEFTVHKRTDMMNFPPDESFTTTIYPWMPSMGHGSPNNVDPVASGQGHYKGKVNFTMTGDWQIKVYLQKNGVTDSTYFDLIF